MDIYDSEQEQLEALKRWWKENGTITIIGLTVGLGAVGGWNWWTSYVEARAESASAIYEQLERAAATNNGDLVDQHGGRILEEYVDSGYAPLAALILAKSAYERGDSAGSRRHLQWVLEHGERPELRQTARLRLVRLSIDSKDYDGALALLDSAEPGEFKAEFEESRGDVLVAQGKREEARAAYERALAEIAVPGSDRARVQLKLDDLGHVNFRADDAEPAK